MNASGACDDGQARFRAFLADPTQRVFSWPTGHPTAPTGFCPCDGGMFTKLRFYARAGWLLALLRWPFNTAKLAALRRQGARVAPQVHIATDVWIDPTFPQLLTIEDQVMIGVGARIALHEFGRDRFRAGRVTLRRGCVIGGFALLAPGVEIGAGAVVAGGAVVGRDVPADMMAVGNPARILPLEAPPPEATPHA